MAGFVAVIVVVDLAVHFYLWKRLVRDVTRPGWRRTAGTVVAAGLAVLVPVTVGATRGGHLWWLAWPGYVWIGLMFYLLVALVPLEVPRLALVLLWRPTSRTSEAAETLSRRQAIARGAAIVAGLTAAGTTGYGMRTALGPPRLQRVQMPLAKLPRSMDGLRLAIVSDIHLGPLARTHHVGRIVDLINSVTADIVCVVGDLVDGSVAELGKFAEPLRGIESRQGAYFVTGNHEYYSGFAPWIDEVASLGVRPLRNERVEIGGLDLAGVNDLGGAQYGDGPDFAKALGDRDPSRPVVLMAHQPVVARQAAPFGVDLQVSGHTHGGQMAPFNLVVKLQQPVVSGFGRVDGVPVFVTNGAGFWGPPLRVGAPPQVTVMDLRSS
ncbi:metallophosphoesterase [Actinoplanes sp. NPDC051343]|uniref:metallophosphoesterase n=1 Tax=Actinoplanes sp. NPDC051343 TaxID=3363906 RepID=UPI0037B43786